MLQLIDFKKANECTMYTGSLFCLGKRPDGAKVEISHYLKENKNDNMIRM